MNCIYDSGLKPGQKSINSSVCYYFALLHIMNPTNVIYLQFKFDIMVRHILTKNKYYLVLTTITTTKVGCV